MSAGLASVELGDAVLRPPLQRGGVPDDTMLTIAIEMRDAPVERGNEVAQPSSQICPLLVG
jgi:hypothetical protein